MMTDENRTRLLHKLRALRAVLQVAIGKIESAKDNPNADAERLDKIAANLNGTLEIVNRAIKTLQDLPRTLGRAHTSPSGAREYTEMETVDEYRKFQNMPPISLDEVADTNIDDLISKLLP